MHPVIKISSPATKDFWEVPILFEDEHLLALDKPIRLLTTPDRKELDRPSLMALIHAGIIQKKPWAVEHQLGYVIQTHRLDYDTSGVLLLAKTKPALVAIANLFSTDKPLRSYVALCHGNPPEDAFEVNAAIGPDSIKAGVMRVSSKDGKKSRTLFEVMERFNRYSLLRCRPVIERNHQVRVHLHHHHFPIVGDFIYGGNELLLSKMKSGYSLKFNQTERPLIFSAAIHAERLEFIHPFTQQPLSITAEWPKDLKVAIKYLRKFDQRKTAAENADPVI